MKSDKSFSVEYKQVLANLPLYRDELTTLMTENFHLFGKTG